MLLQNACVKLWLPFLSLISFISCQHQRDIFDFSDLVVSRNTRRLLYSLKNTYSELSNKHAANLILFEKIFPPTCLIRTYTFIYFQGKFLPTRLLEYLCLLILAEIPNYKIILSSFKLLFCCFKHFKEASKS